MPYLIDWKEHLRRNGTIRVGIFLFPEVEVLDFAGPYEVFSVAGRVAGRALGISSPFEVLTVAVESRHLTARHGLRVVPDTDIRSAGELDLVVIPGGVADQPMNDAAALAWIEQASAKAALTASVCTGAFLLAKAGLVGRGPVTTHWEDIGDLRTAFPTLRVLEDTAYVDTGRVVTSAGISAGISMSLHLVQRILGEDIAIGTARQMQYDWKPGEGIVIDEAEGG